MKNYLGKILKCIINEDYRFNVLSNFGFYNSMNDEEYLKRKYKAIMHKELDLDNPRTFNEKLQWLKLNDKNPEYTLMVDKYKAREFVEKKIGKEHVVPLIGVWDSPDQIDFEKLPRQFVLKCNHNSGLGMYICKDKNLLQKEDYRLIRKRLALGLSQDYYSIYKEWPYKNVKKKIICEKYMTDSHVKNVLKCENDGLIDYKFYCFNGEPKFLYVGFANIVDGVKHDLLTYLTLDWNTPPFFRDDHPTLPNIPPKPACLDDMIKYASILAEGIPFVRVDFFVIDNIVYFSEFTFSPGAGFSKFSPDEWENRLGEWIQLSEKDIKKR